MGLLRRRNIFLRKVDEVVMLPCHLKRRRTALPIA
ncbi:Uncharacterised protein [Vibrio cholerae]|nr:Uncharacterised protein [Vibrio cholerae]